MLGFLFFDFNLFEIGLDDPPSPFGLRLFPLWKSELSFTIFETSKFDRFLLGENWPGLFSRTKGEITYSQTPKNRTCFYAKNPDIGQNLADTFFIELFD